MLSIILAPLMLLGVTGEYYVHLKADYPGSDLKFLPKNEVVNTGACARKCEEHDGCEIWAYINEDYADKRIPPGCYLKGNGGQLLLNTPGIIVGRPFDKVRHSRICAMDYGVDYNGFDIGTESANSPDECCAVCQANESCAAFTYLESRKDCLLKGAGVLAIRNPNEAIISGRKVSCTKFKEIPGKKFAQNKYSGHVTVTKSAKDCMRECMLTIGCNLAEWNTKGQNCRISGVNPDEKPESLAENTNSDRVLFQRID